MSKRLLLRLVDMEDIIMLLMEERRGEAISFDAPELRRRSRVVSIAL